MNQHWHIIIYCGDGPGPGEEDEFHQKQSLAVEVMPPFWGEIIGNCIEGHILVWITDDISKTLKAVMYFQAHCHARHSASHEPPAYFLGRSAGLCHVLHHHKGHTGPSFLQPEDKKKQDFKKWSLAFHRCNHGNEKQMCYLSAGAGTLKGALLLLKGQLVGDRKVH